MKKIIAALLSVSLLLGLAGCCSGTGDTMETSADVSEETVRKAGYSGNDYLEGHDTFEVTSTDLTDGIWNEVISNTSDGKNVSPELSWAPVEGAACYAVYMVDMDTNGFLHWKSNGIDVTELQEGWAPKSDYIGPYPPEGTTHTYVVYVIALRTPVERLKGALNGSNPKMESFIQAVDTDDSGNTGNIISYGLLAGTYTA